MSNTPPPSCRACGGMLKVPQTQICLQCGDADDDASEQRAEIIMLGCVLALVMLLGIGSIWAMS